MQVTAGDTATGRLAYWRLKLEAMAWLLIGQPGRAESAFSDMLARWPTNAYALASRAHVRAQTGRHGEALVDAQALVEAHPRRSAGDWFNLAYLLEHLKQPAQAEAAFRQTVALDPKLDRAWYGLGLVLIQPGTVSKTPSLRSSATPTCSR